MRTILIREFDGDRFDAVYELDLRQLDPKDCLGCWNCWLKTPGKCAHQDLNEFYPQYLAADRVIILAEIRKGFVTGQLKTLLDRLIPLYLPYIEFTETGCNHLPRYEKYPDVEFYYRGDFQTEQGRQVLEDFVRRTFTQFRSKQITIREFARSEA